MRAAHGSNQKSMLVFTAAPLYDHAMLRTETPTRTLTLVLPESEWRALRDAEPDAVGWLQQQIQHRLHPVETAPAAPPATEEYEEY